MRRLATYPQAANTGSRDQARVGLLLAGVATGTNIPVPLLLVYQHRLPMSAAQTTGLFAIYAAGLIPAIFLAGPAADVWGRRRLVLPAALGSAVVSALFMLAADSVAWLYLVRFLQGVVGGTVFTVGSAWLVEIAATRGTGRGARAAAVAMTGGFSFGSLVGGILGQWGPKPLAVPYLAHIVLTVMAAYLAWPVADSLIPNRPGGALARSSPLLPGQVRRALLVIAPPAVCVYGFPATAINAIPVLVGMPVAPVATTGILAGITLGAGSLAAPLQQRIGSRTVPAAVVCGMVGMALAAVAAAFPAVTVLIVPSVVALGVGGGLSLSGGLARLPGVAAAGRLATVSSGFYSVAYLGFGIPVLLVQVTVTVDVMVPLSGLAVVCGLLAYQQLRADF